MNLSKFTERLSELMFEANLNGHTLPQLLGCGENTIYRYLQGSTEPTLDMLILLFCLLKVSLHLNLPLF